jgi:hypothetical protein
LVGIEPASMTAVFCHNAADRKAETWRQRLLPFEHLEFVVSDADKDRLVAGRAQQAGGQACRSLTFFRLSGLAGLFRMYAWYTKSSRLSRLNESMTCRSCWHT